MRILKYIFLLLLLSLVALSIFIATQKGDYSIERSKIINSPKSSVYNYVNDYRNWQDFGSWSNGDPELKVTYPQNTIGKGASYSWEGKNGNGTITTTFIKENDSIAQKMEYDGTSSLVYWKFKDTTGGTKVTWSTKGTMSFYFKIYAALNGGADKIIGTMYEKSLASIDKNLDYEINTFSVKADGIVKKPTSYYLAQTFSSEISKINKNFKIVVPKITAFCKENNVTINGDPFIIYHTYDTPSGIAKISIALPISSEIFISAGSDINSGKIEAFEAVKVTLTGDYSHLKKGYEKAVSYLNQKKLTRDSKFSYLEMYTSGKDGVKNPSKWITEIYIPLLSKIIPESTYIQPTTTINSTTPTPEPTKTVEPVKVVKKTAPKKVAQPKPKEEEESEF